MFEYKIVRVEGKGIFDRKPEGDYHKLIEEYANKGWRLVQIFKPQIMLVWAIPTYYEIIFEREV